MNSPTPRATLATPETEGLIYTTNGTKYIGSGCAPEVFPTFKPKASWFSGPKEPTKVQVVTQPGLSGLPSSSETKLGKISEGSSESGSASSGKSLQKIANSVDKVAKADKVDKPTDKVADKPKVNTSANKEAAVPKAKETAVANKEAAIAKDKLTKEESSKKLKAKQENFSSRHLLFSVLALLVLCALGLLVQIQRLNAN